MPFNIKESDRIRTDEIPELVGINKIVVGSGSENKRQANAALFVGFENNIISLRPEDITGKEESAGVDAVAVAAEKGDAVDQYLERTERQDELIVAGDVVVVVWKPGEDVDQGRYLNRFDRNVDTDNPAEMADAQQLALSTAQMLYTNGSFYVVWHVGTNIRRPSRGWENSAGIRIKAKMKELPEALVAERAGSVEALKDNSIVNLVSLLGEHAEKVTINNRANGNNGEVEIDPHDPLLPLLVLGCAIPHGLITQLVSSETLMLPDGTKSLNFSEFDIIRKRD